MRIAGETQSVPPTDQALPAEVAATPSRKPESLRDELDQAVPFQCMISAPPGSRPTAQTSLADVAAVPYSRPLTAGTDDGARPGAATAAVAGAARHSAAPAAAAAHACRRCLRTKSINFPRNW